MITFEEYSLVKL